MPLHIEYDCPCVRLGQYRLECAKCMEQKRAAEDEQDREFERLQKQNPNLEDRGIFTFMEQKLTEDWKSLNQPSMQSKKANMKKDADKQNKALHIFHREQFKASVDMDYEWSKLDSYDKIKHMEAAALFGFNVKVIQQNNKRTFELIVPCANPTPTEDRSKFWNSNIHYFYDSLSTQELDYPSMVCQWGSQLKDMADKNFHRLYLSERITDGTRLNTLLVADAQVPKSGVAAAGLAQFDLDARSRIVNVHKTLTLAKPLLRISEFPTSPQHVAVIFEDCSHLAIFDIDSQKDRDPLVSKCSTNSMTIWGQNLPIRSLDACSVEPYLIFGGEDKTVGLWSPNDTGSGNAKYPRKTFEGHEGHVLGVKFCPGSTHTFCSVDHNTLILWDDRSYYPAQKVEKTDKEFFTCVDWSSHDSNFLLTGSSRSVSIYDVRNLTSPLQNFSGHNTYVNSVQWCPSKKAVFASQSQNEINVWDQDNNVLILSHIGHRKRITDFAWNNSDPMVLVSVSDNSRRTFVGDTYRRSGGGTIQIWRMLDSLQENSNKLENRLLSQFDAASERREFTKMAECDKILSQFNRGTSARQHYVATRPMFIDVEVMNADTRLVLGDQAAQTSPDNVARGLSSLYEEITDTVRKEAETITAVFPSPSEAMSILVQRVLEQRVKALLGKILIKPSTEVGLLFYLQRLAVAYEKTRELAGKLASLDCGDLDVEGLTESLFSNHKDDYSEYEKKFLRHLYKVKMEELRAESQKLRAESQISESSGTIGCSMGATVASSPQQISVIVVKEFKRWNEEAIARCNLCSSQPALFATHVLAVFNCLIDQVHQYLAEGLEQARHSLTQATKLRKRLVLRTTVSSEAEAAAAACESELSTLMFAVQRSGSCLDIIRQYFTSSISTHLLPGGVAHSDACEYKDTNFFDVTNAAHTGLQQCIDTVMEEVVRLLSSEQNAADYLSPDNAITPDHQPTTACTRVVAFLLRVLESASTALEGLNKQNFLSHMGYRLHKALLNHWQKYTFDSSGGLRLKCDITKYGVVVQRFNDRSVDEKFKLLDRMARVFIESPESLLTLFEDTPDIRKDAQRFVQLREDYKSANLASKLSSWWS